VKGRENLDARSLHFHPLNGELCVHDFDMKLVIVLETYQHSFGEDSGQERD